MKSEYEALEKYERELKLEANKEQEHVKIDFKKKKFVRNAFSVIKRTLNNLLGKVTESEDNYDEWGETPTKSE